MSNQAFLRQAGVEFLGEMTSEEGEWHYVTMPASGSVELESGR
jgi:hypothetical protein